MSRAIYYSCGWSGSLGFEGLGSNLAGRVLKRSDAQGLALDSRCVIPGEVWMLVILDSRGGGVADSGVFSGVLFSYSGGEARGLWELGGLSSREASDVW